MDPIRPSTTALSGGTGVWEGIFATGVGDRICLEAMQLYKHVIADEGFDRQFTRCIRP